MNNDIKEAFFNSVFNNLLKHFSEEQLDDLNINIDTWNFKRVA
jgi:hypothetical protein